MSIPRGRSGRILRDMEVLMSQSSNPIAAARSFDKPAAVALSAALDAGLAGYDRQRALMRFHRLSGETIPAETTEAARLVVAEIERALRRERGRMGHWSYDLNHHIALMIAHRAETARLRRLQTKG